MDYWQTIELIKQDWGMGHPVADREARYSTIALIADIGGYMEEYDGLWLDEHSLFMMESEGAVSLYKGDALCQIRQGPSGKLIVNGTLMEPENYDFTLEFYKKVKREIEKWAMSVS